MNTNELRQRAVESLKHNTLQAICKEIKAKGYSINDVVLFYNEEYVSDSDALKAKRTQRNTARNRANNAMLARKAKAQRVVRLKDSVTSEVV